ncbi:MAG: glycosyltransferase family 39 protein [Candidatus Omnitrophota bacterium]|nr:glycosyltransferase family 39 protein [Candidatus Omnitrophota bacterium]
MRPFFSLATNQIGSHSADHSPSVRTWIAYGGLALFLAVNAVYMKFTYMHVFFDPNDHGGFLDMAWRILRGQKIYVDFLYHNGPFFPYTMAFFMTVFGFGKTAILAHLLLTSSLNTILTFFILRKHTPLVVTLVLTALAMVSFHWAYPFPNYTHDAFVWGLLGVLVLSSRMPLQGATTAFGSGLLCGLIAVAAFMTKFNIGAIYGLTFILVLISSAERFSGIKGFVTGAVLMLLVSWIFIGDVNGFLNYNILPFMRGAVIAERSSALWASLPDWAERHYWLVAVVVLAGVWTHLLKMSQWIVLFLGAVMCAMFTHRTNSLSPLIILPNVLGFILFYRLSVAAMPGIRALIFRTMFGALVIITGVQIIPFARYIATDIFHDNVGKSTLILEGYPGSADPETLAKVTEHKDWVSKEIRNYPIISNYVLKSEPLAGWLCNQEWGEPLDGIVSAIKKHVPGDQTVLVLSTMQLIYPLTGRDSFRGMTFHFNLPGVPELDVQAPRVRAAIVEHPPDWIVTHRDVSVFPINALVHYLQLTDYINNNYARVNDEWGSFGMLRRIQKQ